MAGCHVSAKPVLSHLGWGTAMPVNLARVISPTPPDWGPSAIGLVEGLSDMASRPFIVIRLVPASPVDGTAFDTLDSTIYCNVKVKNAELPAAGQCQAISASDASLYRTLPPPPDESASASSCY
jgi:hypothetical protein